MGIFGKVGRAVGGGGFARAGQAMLGGGGGGQMGGALGQLSSAVRQKAPGMIQQARPGFERLSQQKGPFGGMAKAWLAQNPAQSGMAPPPQMPGAPGATAGQVSAAMQGMGQMKQMGMEGMGVPDPSQMQQPAPGPSALQMGIQQAIGGNPQEADPYEAWKAGGRQGNRPSGY